MLDVINPYNDEVIDRIPLTPWEEIDAMLAQMGTLYRDRDSWIPVHRRIEILHRAAALMQQRFDDLALLIAREGGKPLVDARVEVTRAIDGVNLCVKELGHLRGSEIPLNLTAAGAGRAAFTFREPIGPVVAVSAFNHPLNLIVHQIGPAVAAGCPAIVKPANDTPLSARAFVDMLHQAGLPEEWCRCVSTDRQAAERMVTDPRIAFFTFIGSAEVGWKLKSKLAPGTRCALEHGGVAPVIVDDTADLERMLPALLKGGFYHAGQVCVSVQKVFAPRAMAANLAEQLAAGASQLVVGDATNPDTQVGPLIRNREVDRVAEWVDEAVSGGARLLCGGKKLGSSTYAPTVLLDPPDSSRVSTSEVFGPVVCVYSYETLDSAIDAANSLPFSFQAACFTNRLDTAMRCVSRLDAAAVMVNDHTAFRVDWMPFAGHRHSGYGTGGIGYTLHDMTREKMMVLNHFDDK